MCFTGHQYTLVSGGLTGMNKKLCGEMLPLDLGFPVSRIKGALAFTQMSAYSSGTSNWEDFGKGCVWLPSCHAV